jgi:hypothetical protein
MIVQYPRPTQKSEQWFICFKPPNHISGNCLAFDPNFGVWGTLQKIAMRISRFYDEVISYKPSTNFFLCGPERPAVEAWTSKILNIYLIIF